MVLCNSMVFLRNYQLIYICTSIIFNTFINLPPRHYLHSQKFQHQNKEVCRQDKNMHGM